MTRWMNGFAGMVVVLCVSGCAGLRSEKVSPDTFTQFRPPAVVERTLKSGDRLQFSVEVDGKPEIDGRSATIDHTGCITVPLAGDLQVVGKTPSEVRAVLKDAYSRFYVSDPLVILTMGNEQDEGVWGTVTVLGQVKNSGSVALSASSLRLSEAIQKAGGFDSGARQNAVRVSRETKEGRRIQCTIDFQAIGREGQSGSDLELFSGDVVYVPERIF